MKTKIGFIGVGLMGKGMARSLIRAGYEVSIYNRTRDKAEEVARLGGVVVDSPAEAARGADVVVTMLANPAALLAVVEGERGVLTTIKPGAVLIDSSTVSPPTTYRVLKQLNARGADMIDAPVFGSKNEAETGALGFIVGGDPAVLARVQGVFDAMGRTMRVGDNGMGAYAKLVVNLVIAGTLQAFNEGLVMAAKSGIDAQAMVEIIQSSRARSGIIEMKAPQILKRDFNPFFPLQLMAKDMGLIRESAAALGLNLPLANAVSQVYDQCLADGLGAEDFAASIKLVEAQAGLKVGKNGA
jgi:3-hydroxyisobutyrate dehydrogenase-like beta-hydroxyacid dehydrogenase